MTWWIDRAVGAPASGGAGDALSQPEAEFQHRPTSESAPPVFRARVGLGQMNLGRRGRGVSGMVVA
jgi:hypothetical protein